MKILVAESAGFCYGVSRAVAICEKAANENHDCVTLGPIIHNEHVTRDLEKRGVRIVSCLSEINAQNTVIIRSHGASKEEYDALAALGADVIDATCPDVRKIHDIVRNESHDDRLILLIGRHDHPEISAIRSWCGKCEIFETSEELKSWLDVEGNSQKKVSVVFQTTNSGSVYDECSALIKKECTNHRIFDTICDATCRRQQEAVEISKVADIVIIVGDNNSANSHKLADICRQHCARVIFAQSADDIDTAKIRDTDVVGITAGASTPAFIIKEVTRKMSKETSMDGTLIEQETSVDAAVADALSEPEAEVKTEKAESMTEPEASAEPIMSTEPETPPLEAKPQIQQEETEEPGAALMQTEPQITEDEAAESEAVIEQQDAAALQTDEQLPQAEMQIPQAEAQSSQAKPQIQPEEAPDSATVTALYPDDVPESTAGDQQEMTESFEEMLEKSIKTLRTGEKVTGIVTSITSTEVSLDLGTKQSGYIPITEFIDYENTNIDDIIKIGDTIESFVMRVNDVEGMVMLSKKRLDAIKNWDIVESAKDNKTIVEGTVVEDNKGGIVVNVKGVRVFVPASQTGLPKSAPMTELLKKTVKLRITEVNQSRRRVVGSIRLVQNDERRERSEKVWTDIEVGRKYDGVVKSMTTYGVFVDIGGVDGMIHISELSWTRIKQPSEIMSVGDEVSVYVLSFDRESRKISLGYKKGEDNPWTKFTSHYTVGDVINVKIVKMMPFGAFAEICPGVDGLIHISQITDHRIGLPSEVLSDGQMVDVKITEIDNDRKKVSLSIKALIEPSSQPLTESEVAEAAADDRAPVVVYDTDSPPQFDEEEE